MKDFIELTDVGTAANWIPSEAWADLILEASVCYGQLSGVITAVDYDLAAGNGKIVRVRTVPARTAQTPNEDGCLSATSTTLGKADITISRYGDYDEFVGFALWEAKGPVVKAVLREMSKGFAKKRDEEIWTALLDGGAAGNKLSLGSALSRIDNTGAVLQPKWWVHESQASGIYGTAQNLYNSIVWSAASMRADCYEPDYVIMNPEVAAFIKMVADDSTLKAQITVNDSGILTNVAGLKVIESGNAKPHGPNPAGASTASGYFTSSVTIACVIDSRKAVGEAWGMRPKFVSDYNVACDRYNHAVHAYWGTAKIDNSAIARIENP